MATFDQLFEEFKVAGKDVVEKVRELIHEGNVRRVIIKNEQGHTVVEIPLTVATVGAVAAPVLAAVGALAAVMTHCQIVVERTTPPPPPGGPSGTGS